MMMKTENLKNIVDLTRVSLELVFISFFIYSTLFFTNLYVVMSRIWILTILIFILFVIQIPWSAKDKLKNLFNPTVIFFIVFSATQTLKNIYMPCGLPVLLYEIIHYGLIIFVLFYNFKDRKFLDTGLVLFTVYSFRIFDLHLADNEFVLIHGLTVILALIWLEEIYLKQKMLPIPKSILFPLVIFIIIVIFSTINSVCPYNSLAQAAVMINFIFIAFLIGTYFKDIKQVDLLILAFFLIGGVLVFLVARELHFRLAVAKDIRWALERIAISDPARPYPYAIHSNSIADYFITLLCLIIGSAFFYKVNIVRTITALFAIIMLFILGLTYSRLGIFSFIFALLLLLLLRHKRLINFVKTKLIFFILAASLAMSIIVLTPLIKRNIIGKYRYPDANFYSCKITLGVIKDNPLFGAGLENYYLLSQYAKESIAAPFPDRIIKITQDVIRSAPHSLYLGIAFGLGFIGLAAFIWLLIDFIVYCLRLNGSLQSEGYHKGVLVGFFAAFIAMFIHGILSMTFHLTILPAFFWIFMGLTISIGNITGYNKKISYRFKPWKAYAALIVVMLISIGIVINPILAERYYALALTDFNSRQLNKALKNVSIAKRFMPIDPKLYALTAEIQARQGLIAYALTAEVQTRNRLIDAAINSYREALYFKKDFAFYHSRLGQLYRQKKMYIYALTEFNKAIILDRYGVWFREHYSDLGVLYEDLGRREDAIVQFQKALLIKPEKVINSNWQGLKYLDSLLTRMLQDYDIEKNRHPLVAKEILFCLSRIYTYRGQLDKAEKLNLILGLK